MPSLEQIVISNLVYWNLVDSTTSDHVLEQTFTVPQPAPLDPRLNLNGITLVPTRAPGGTPVLGSVGVPRKLQHNHEYRVRALRASYDLGSSRGVMADRSARRHPHSRIPHPNSNIHTVADRDSDSDADRHADCDRHVHGNPRQWRTRFHGLTATALGSPLVELRHQARTHAMGTRLLFAGRRVLWKDSEWLVIWTAHNTEVALVERQHVAATVACGQHHD